MTWQDFICAEMTKPYFRELSKFLAQEEKKHAIYPPKEKIFAAFDACSLDKVRAIILSQDPYINKNEAVGLCFSVPKGVAIPPSLRNIYKELHNDLGIEPATHGCLERWAREEGLLLLNSALTVRAGAPGSHSKQWQTFTDSAIKLINEQDRSIVYILWGSHAQSKRHLLTNKLHMQIIGAHPSPLSANKGGFFGGKYFSRANEFLVKNGINPIDWRV